MQVRTPHSAEFSLETERLGPLPLVNHFIERMGLAGLLEKYVPTTDPRSRVSNAKALGVLLRSIVVEREPIYRAQETVHGFATGLFGVAGGSLKLKSLSDDRLGRALDRLFEADRAALLTEVVLAVAKRFAVQLKEYVADSKLCSHDNLSFIDRAGGRFVTVMPVAAGGQALSQMAPDRHPGLGARLGPSLGAPPRRAARCLVRLP
jgi:hypothetical protein